MKGKDERRVGAMWKKHGPYGEFLSGVIEISGQIINITASPNKSKNKDNQPDYVIRIR